MKNNEAKEPIHEYSKPLNFETVWQLFMETDKKFKETDVKFQETDKKFQETDKQFKESEKRMKGLQNLFTSQWGKLIESLVEGDLIRELNQRQIAVQRTIQRISGCVKGENFEFDIIAINGEEIVIVEVKTTLRPDDIKEFMNKLSMAKTWMQEYKNSRIYGAVAFQKAYSGCDKMAANQGLFVIRATGNSASIKNTKDFQPRIY